MEKQNKIPDRRAMEKMTSDLAGLRQGQNFKSEEELKTYLDGVVKGGRCLRLCEYRIADDGIAEEEIFTVIFRDEPVAISYEEVDMDWLVLQRDLFGFIELREHCELFSC